MEFQEPDLEAYTNNFSNQIGRGGFSRVYGGEIPVENNYNLPPLRIAVKQSINNRDRPVFENEIANTPTDLNIPNSVHLVGFCRTADTIYIVVPLIDGGSLYNSITRLTWEQVVGILRGLVAGITHFHDRNMVLGDLKPQNVLLDAGSTPKLCDFGAVSAVGTDIIEMTRDYRDPLSRNRGVRQKDDDIYALGIIMLQLLMKKQRPNENGLLIPSQAMQLYRRRGHVVHGSLRKSGCRIDDAKALSKLALTLTSSTQEELKKFNVTSNVDNLNDYVRPTIDFVGASLLPIRVTPLTFPEKMADKVKGTRPKLCFRNF